MRKLDRTEGNDEYAILALGGQVVGRITEVRPVADIIRECADECLSVLHDLAARYPGP